MQDRVPAPHQGFLPDHVQDGGAEGLGGREERRRQGPDDLCGRRLQQHQQNHQIKNQFFFLDLCVNVQKKKLSLCCFYLNEIWNVWLLVVHFGPIHKIPTIYYLSKTLNTIFISRDGNKHSSDTGGRSSSILLSCLPSVTLNGNKDLFLFFLKWTILLAAASEHTCDVRKGRSQASWPTRCLRASL